MALELFGQTAADPSQGAFLSVAGQVPAVPVGVLLGPKGSSYAELSPYFAAIHQGYLQLNDAAARLEGLPCWADSAALWRQARDAWVAFYTRGVNAAAVPGARDFAQKLLRWRSSVYAHCRAPDPVIRLWAEGVPAVYQLTPDDILWLKRMVQAEVRWGIEPALYKAEARRIAQTMLNRFFFARKQQGFTSSLTKLIQLYSEPMKPTASTAKQLADKARTSFYPTTEEAVRIALTRGPVDIARGTIHWGAPGFAAKDPSKARSYIQTFPPPGTRDPRLNEYFAQSNSVDWPGYTTRVT